MTANQKDKNDIPLFTIKIERHAPDGDKRLDLYQSTKVHIDEAGADRIISWWDPEYVTDVRVVVSYNDRSTVGELEGQAAGFDPNPARVVYIENAAGSTTHIVRPKR